MDEKRVIAASDEVTPTLGPTQRPRGRGIRFSRAQALAAGAGLALAAIPGRSFASGAPFLAFPYFPPVTGTYTTEQIQDILNAIITTRYLVADFSFFAVKSGTLSGPALAQQQVGAARFQYEIDFLSAIGASPVATTATLDPNALKDPQLLGKARLGTSLIFLSMFITAVREFAELGQPVLAKWTAQLLAREGESVRDARLAAGDISPATAFAPEFFLYTRDGLAALRATGFFAGQGIPVPYPGRDAMLAAAGPAAEAVGQRRPNDANTSVVLTGLGDIDKVLGQRT